MESDAEDEVQNLRTEPNRISIESTDFSSSTREDQSLDMGPDNDIMRNQENIQILTGFENNVSAMNTNVEESSTTRTPGFRQFDREVFVSPEEDMFAVSVPPSRMIESRLLSIISEVHSPTEGSQSPSRRTQEQRAVSQTTDERGRTLYRLRQRTPMGSNIMERWQWLVSATEESEWLRRCRNVYGSFEDASYNVLQEWETFNSCNNDKSIKEPRMEDKYHFQRIRVNHIDLKSTRPSDFQQPRINCDTNTTPDRDEITGFDISYGADPQGIPWRGPGASRQDFRLRRLQDIQLQPDFRSMSNEASQQSLRQVRQYRSRYQTASKQTAKYHFWKTIRCNPRPTADHFQLRHLLHAVTSTDIILCNTSATSGKLACGALNTTTGRIKWIHGRRWQPPRTSYRIRGIASLHSRFGFVVSGFLDSTVSISDLGRNYEALHWENDKSRGQTKNELVYDLFQNSTRSDGAIDNLDNNEDECFFRSSHSTYDSLIDDELGLRPQNWEPFCTPRAEEQPITWLGRKVLNLLRVSEEDDNIVNSVRLEPGTCDNENDATNVSLFTACNDHTVAEWTLDGQLKWRVTLPWCANHFAVSPSRRLMSIGADSKRVVMLDLATKSPIFSLEGHQDFTFSASWHPDPNSFLFATGNQDNTCRIWDIRRPNSPLFILASACSAVRCVSFSPDGQTLAFGESKDFICMYNVLSQFREYDCIDCFGEPVGLSFSPDSSRLFVGIAEPLYGGVIELRRGIPQTASRSNKNYHPYQLLEPNSIQPCRVDEEGDHGTEDSGNVYSENVESISGVSSSQSWLDIQLASLRNLCTQLDECSHKSPDSNIANTCTISTLDELVHNIAEESSELHALELNPLQMVTRPGANSTSNLESLGSSEDLVDPTDNHTFRKWIEVRSSVGPLLPPDELTSSDISVGQSIPDIRLPFVSYFSNPPAPSPSDTITGHSESSSLETNLSSNGARWLSLWDPTVRSSSPEIKRSYIDRRVGMN